MQKLAILASLMTAIACAAEIPAPLITSVTGPVPAAATPPDPSHGYPYNPTYLDLASPGYVEEEFFIAGTANHYNTSPEANATLVDSGHPFKTRIVVRRPKSAAKFNGTAILEWTNVTGSRDLEMDWFQSGEYFIRSGYVWIGVDAQHVGVDALRGWSPNRYSSLDVSDGGKFSRDELSYDILTATALLIRAKPEVIGGLKPERLIATGHSQSAARLGIYVNSVHPLHPVFDAVMLHGGGGKIRTDLNVKVWKMLSETDVRGGPAARQPDTDKFRTWEVAGTSHVDAQSVRHFTALARLNAGAPPGVPPSATQCDKPMYSQVPFHYVFDAAFDWMVKWIQGGTPPPSAPPIDFTSGATPSIARDENGNALGGIRLAEFAVATGVNTGQNSGPGFCRLYGSHVDFDAARLASLYPTHPGYVARVKEVTEKNLSAGYILKPDAEATIAAAERSSIGK